MLKSKPAKKRRTNEYRANQIKELEATETVRKFAVRKRATITEEQSAFKAYANPYTISNFHLKGLNGLTYFPYQFERLNEYLEKQKGMKLNATVKISVVNIFDDMQDVRKTGYWSQNFRHGTLPTRINGSQSSRNSYDVQQIQPNKSRYIY